MWQGVCWPLVINLILHYKNCSERYFLSSLNVYFSIYICVISYSRTGDVHHVLNLHNYSTWAVGFTWKSGHISFLSCDGTNNYQFLIILISIASILAYPIEMCVHSALFSQGMVARFIAIRRRNTVKVTNQRVGLMTEILDSIRLIKMYGWESNFSRKVKGSRTFHVSFKKLSNNSYLLLILFEYLNSFRNFKYRAA